MSAPNASQIDSKPAVLSSLINGPAAKTHHYIQCRVCSCIAYHLSASSATLVDCRTVRKVALSPGGDPSGAGMRPWVPLQ